MASGKKSAGNTALKIIITVVLAGMVILGIFMVFNRSRGKKQSDEDNLVLSRVQEITTLNLDINYPGGEQEVINLFGRIMQTLYAEDCTEADVYMMADQLQILYDDELVANQTNYPAQLMREVNQKKTDGFTIQNYIPAEKRTISYFKEGGRECAGIECTFSIRRATEIEATIYVFILRKDDMGRWHILGWQPKEDQSVNLFARGASPDIYGFMNLFFITSGRTGSGLLRTGNSLS